MPALVTFGDAEALAVVRSVLLGLLPDDVEVIRAQSNRVPEPATPDFCVLTPLRRERLSTNRDINTDIILTGGIAGDTLTVETYRGATTLLRGYPLYGAVVAPGTVVTWVNETPDEYTVTPPQTVPPGSAIYAGRHAMIHAADLVYQCDVHGPASDANAMIIATTWRDDAGVTLITTGAGPLEMAPLYAGDPAQVPFINAESQWENRWIVELHLQANITVSLAVTAKR